MSNGFDPSQNQQEQGGDLRDLMPELPESTVIVERPPSGLYTVPAEVEGETSPAVRTQQEMLENFAQSGYVDAQAVLGIQYTPGLDLSGLGLLRPGMERLAQQAGYHTDEEFYDIRKYEVLKQLPSEAETGAQTYLALDMFLNVDGAYSRIEEVFNPDGTVNQGTFLDALDQTFKLAYEAGPDMYKTTPLFLDILLGNRDASLEELEALFVERAGSNRRSGRVISYLDPVGLAKAAENAFSQVTGRKATKREQQEFVKVIHGLQSSGQMSIDVGARAEAQARAVSPVEAGAMDHAGAGNLLLQAIGMAR